MLLGRMHRVEERAQAKELTENSFLQMFFFWMPKHSKNAQWHPQLQAITELLPQQPTFCNKSSSKIKFIEEIFQDFCFKNKFVKKSY